MDQGDLFLVRVWVQLKMLLMLQNCSGGAVEQKRLPVLIPTLSGSTSPVGPNPFRFSSKEYVWLCACLSCSFSYCGNLSVERISYTAERSGSIFALPTTLPQGRWGNSRYGTVASTLRISERWEVIAFLSLSKKLTIIA